MKKARGKPRAKALHTPCKELAAALAMPAVKTRNVHKKPRKETVEDYIAAIKAAAHTR